MPAKAGNQIDTSEFDPPGISPTKMNTHPAAATEKQLGTTASQAHTLFVCLLRGPALAVRFLGESSPCRLDAARDVVVRHWTLPLAQPQLVQREMFEALHARVFERLPCAVDGATVDDKDTFRAFCNGDEVLDPPADASEAGHLAHALARELTRNAVSEFASIRGAGAGVNDWFGIR